MTISSLTDTELDRMILRKRDGWDDEDFTLPKEARKEYSTDPRYAMELLKEMPNCALKRWGDKWCCGIYNDKGYLENQANMYDTPERAISEAWLQWQEQG